MRRFRDFTRVALVVLVASAGAAVVPTVAWADGGPTNGSPPTVTGTPGVGQTLTETGGTWNNVTLMPPPSDTIEWEDCPVSTATKCPAIPNSPTTSPSTYTLGPGDVGRFIVVVETVTAANGTASARSVPVGIVTTTSTTGLAVSPQPSVANQTVTLVATVTADATPGPGSVGPSGAVAFFDGGTPISGCNGVPVSTKDQSVTVSCQTAFAASAAQLSAVFTANPGAAVAGSSSPVDVLSVGRDSTSTSLYVPSGIVSGEPTTFIAQVSPPAARPGPLEPTGTVEFLEGAKPIAGCLAQPIGPTGATCTTTYLSTGSRAITARYGGDGNFDPSASTPQTARVAARARITSTMQWTFSFTPTYTKVLTLMVRGVAHDRVVVHCHGKGCPFSRRAHTVLPHTICTHKAHGRCTQTRSSGSTLNLGPGFGTRHLAVGAQITVAITRPGWVGKYYTFKVESGRAPRIQIGCLAPGSTKPGKTC